MVASPVSLASHSSPAGASSIGASRSSAPSSSSSGTTTMRGRARVSSYDATLTANQAIRKRELHTFSVHFSVQNCKWVATIARAELPSSTADAAEKRRVQSFHFQTEREARKFAKVYSPPKMIADEPNCMVCQRQFTAKCRASNCRNCGVSICDDCSTRWASRMVPKTYSQQNLQIAPLTVRVCKSCDWLSNAFCMALLQGKHENVVSLVNTGNVNLRSSFADIHREAMFPIHCAVIGGNLETVRWLVETHDCPLTVKRDKNGTPLSLQTSRNRTLIDLAMTGKPKFDILSYLARRGLSVLDTKDPSLPPKTLQLLMESGLRLENGPEVDFLSGHLSHADSTDQSVASIEDACAICCEKAMDCVLTPCGHQCCCSGCGERLEECPICKAPCSTLRVYRL